ncbi:unnamed protein product [Adineta ricciae]|uniref:Diphthine--ammonia ligase n=1 Tax=Adineta ricciae TaxID=249248 RepID=A0A813NAK4_ADIRI|nr:unnamed protein product [Adineta ricciae]
MEILLNVMERNNIYYCESLDSSSPLQSYTFPSDAFDSSDCPRRINVLNNIMHGDVVCTVTVGLESTYLHRWKRMCKNMGSETKYWPSCKCKRRCSPFTMNNPFSHYDCLERDAYIRCIKLLPDGRTLIVGGKDSSVCIWDLNISSSIRSNGSAIDRGGSYSNSSPMLFESKVCLSVASCDVSQDGNYIVTGSGDKKATLYERPQQEIRSFSLTNCQFSFEESHSFPYVSLIIPFYYSVFDMRVVALISGGKDSTYNMIECVRHGHEIIALANLHPKEDIDELDSYMYQSVGHEIIDLIAKAMNLPLYRAEIKGDAQTTDKEYHQPVTGDEDKHAVEAVSVGAIFSEYQNNRVANVCQRLNLQVLAYLWQRNQHELLNEMINANVQAILIKTAALGLHPRKHLGKTIAEMRPILEELAEKYGINVCGEGGEFETLTLDCSLFKQRIVLDQVKTICTSRTKINLIYVNLLMTIHNTVSAFSRVCMITVVK